MSQLRLDEYYLRVADAMQASENCNNSARSEHYRKEEKEAHANLVSFIVEHQAELLAVFGHKTASPQSWKTELAGMPDRLGSVNRSKIVTFNTIDELIFQLRKEEK